MPGDPNYTSHTTVAAISGAAFGAALVVMAHYYMGDMPPAAEVVAETTVANGLLSVLSSIVMKKFGLLSN